MFGSNNFGGSRNFGGPRDSGPREMTKVTCSDCGKECEVPFKPTSSKPVFCSDCFRSTGGGSDRQSRDRSDRPSPPQQDYSEELRQINLKLDKIILALEIE